MSARSQEKQKKNLGITEGATSTSKTWKIINGDAREGMRSLEAESIDCIVTSPPYFWLRDYGVEGQIGLEETVQSYVDALVEVFEEAFRVLKPKGTLFLNLGDTYYSGKGESQGKDHKSKKRRFGLRQVDRSGGLDIGIQRKSIIGIPWRVAIALCQKKWVLRSPIVWHRDKCLPEAVRDRPRRSYEFVFMFAKSRHYFFNRKPLVDQNLDEDVWTIPPKTQENGKLDTAPFPEELVSRCLSIGCPEEGVVLDPFSGSGTTLITALESGRSCVGIELSQELCDYIANRLEGHML
jgi:DNA modification methylase